jgi:serine/threonine protein kinase/TPR repeat protein
MSPSVQSIGRYRIQSKLGTGGMGVVYLAHDPVLQRLVALKVLKTPDEAGQLLREARSASALNHPNICTIYEIGDHEGLPYIAMEFVEGRALNSLLKEGALHPDTVVRYGRQIASALAHAHRRGIVHRDLKCANTIVTPDGFIKLLDFGIATRVSSSDLDTMTAEAARGDLSRQLAGTPAYMAPEVLRGEPADERSEIWAVGVMLYEMVTGQRPFSGDTTFSLIASILERRLAPLSDSVPEQLRAAINTCLAESRAERFASARDLEVALGASEQTTPTASRTRPAARTQDSKTSTSTVRRRIQSIVVLPLANRCAEPDQDFFVDGMTDALITELSRVHQLRVISRTSSMRYRDTTKTLPEIARELNVDAVVEGSVIRSGQSIRVHVQLIAAEADMHLWAKTYDRDLADVLALHSELAQTIAGEVRVSVNAEELAQLVSARPVNPEAHALYLKGRYFLSKTVWTPADYEQALSYFLQSADVDPGYARAYAGQADTYSRLGGYGLRKPKEAFVLGKAAARRAVELDDNLGEGHIALGLAITLMSWNAVASEQEYIRGLELDPGHEAGQVILAGCLAVQERYTEAVQQCLTALAASPYSSDGHWNMGMIYRLGGWHDRAVEHLQGWLAAEPNDIQSLFQLGLTYADQGQNDGAIDLFQKMAAAHPMLKVLALGPLAYVQGRRGDKAAGESSIKELEAIAMMAPVAPGWIAHGHVGLGNYDAALDWLEKAAEYHDSWNMLLLHAERRWEPIRSHPRFQQLLEFRERVRTR